ncbi:hypothetical protein BDW75DRAFT_238045 [Aspergillus navahoensis]
MTIVEASIYHAKLLPFYLRGPTRYLYPEFELVPNSRRQIWEVPQELWRGRLQEVIPIANRGEIVVRILKTAKKLNIRTIAVYTEPDPASTHVHLADEAFLLSGAPSRAYTDGDQIIGIAKQNCAGAIIPGYGFLSENPNFARDVASAGLVFVGPSPESIEAFGLKHTARELATKAVVPIVPGSQGLVTSDNEAVTVPQSLGFPVMLKATAGGGGMGLLTCNTEKEVRESFQTVQSRGEALFKNAGLFIERYYPSSHHIEIQSLGMDTVEHGITELCYGVYLVELMLQQANAQLSGKKGLEAEFLLGIPAGAPNGAAIEARVYAENPVRDFAPCPGTLQDRGIKVSTNYDPLIAKVMYHAPSRQKAIEGLKGILTGSRICGPPTNLGFLAEILANKDFNAGNTLTKFLNSFECNLSAINVVSGGAYTLIEDWPGRPTVGKGFCHSGPMDSVAFRIAEWFGSKATAPMVGIGGYQGRQLISGDYLAISAQLPELDSELSLPQHLIPQYPDSWEVMSMPGPYDEGYLARESIGMLYDAEWTISHNAARGGIRLLGPKPAWPLRMEERVAGDDYLLVDYGVGAFDLNHRYRVTALKKVLSEATSEISLSVGLTNMVGCGNSLMIYYDGTKIPEQKLINYLCNIETRLGDVSYAMVPSRRFKLPLTSQSKRQDDAIKRYMETQRPYASYLPDNIDFVARNNAFTRAELENIYLTANFMVITVGFFTALPIALPVDPRQHRSPALAIYTVDSPGGYQLNGMTIPGVDILGSKRWYTPEKPWLFEDFDQITSYKVAEEEYERQLALFQSGRYEYEWEEVEFDVEEHNLLLKETKEEAKAIRVRQREAQAEMNLREKELLERWARETAEQGVPIPQNHRNRSAPQCERLESRSEEGDKLEKDEFVVILEAKKLEIAVRAESAAVGAVVEKILALPSDSIEAGKPLVLVRRVEG